MKNNQCPSHSMCLQLLIASFLTLSLTACPDPQDHQYESFNDRQNETFAASVTMNMAGEMMAGEMMAGEMMASEMMAGEMMTDEMMVGEMEEPQSIPQISSGTFLFGLATNLNVNRPITFVAEVEIEVNADGSTGQVISMNLDPRTCEDLNVSAGDPILFSPEESTPIAADGYFSADFGRQIIAGSANCISGSLIEAEVQLDGRVFNETALCGEMSGMLYRPYPWDLGDSELTTERSTFAGIRLEGNEDLSALEIPKNCDDISNLFTSKE